VTVILDLVPTYGDIDQAIPVGLGIEVLFMTDGLVRIAHDCKLTGGAGAEQLRIAPTLATPGHIVAAGLPVTISPSILCSDCGLHGFVIASEWVPA
jgi:hypothetical protein